jgi:hypothetical protein
MSLVLQSILLYPDSCLRTSPHQQGWDTKMEKLSYGGIDVSKDRLDVVVLPEVVNECQARTSAGSGANVVGNGCGAIPVT